MNREVEFKLKVREVYYDGCRGCIGLYDSDLCDMLPECYACDRSDNRNVIFKIVDKEVN